MESDAALRRNWFWKQQLVDRLGDRSDFSIRVFSVIDRVERHDVLLYVVPEAVDAGAYAPLPLSGFNVGELLNAVLSRCVLRVGGKDCKETFEYVGDGRIFFREPLHAAVERGSRKDSKGGGHV